MSDRNLTIIIIFFYFYGAGGRLRVPRHLSALTAVSVLLLAPSAYGQEAQTPHPKPLRSNRAASYPATLRWLRLRRQRRRPRINHPNPRPRQKLRRVRRETQNSRPLPSSRRRRSSRRTRKSQAAERAECRARSSRPRRGEWIGACRCDHRMGAGRRGRQLDLLYRALHRDGEENGPVAARDAADRGRHQQKVSQDLMSPT